MLGILRDFWGAVCGMEARDLDTESCTHPRSKTAGKKVEVHRKETEKNCP